tara:strand:+ start:3925 stop:4449 length:525 start_codon:yes stop_codon:yes gene_type:complete
MKEDWKADDLKPLIGHKISPIADALNLFAGNSKEFRFQIEVDAKKYWYREMLRFVPAPAMKIVSMVLDRTIGWAKVAEIITEDQFQNGIRTTDLDELITSGTGQNAKTIRKYTRILTDKHLMSRFPLKTRGRARYWYTPIFINDLNAKIKAHDDKGLWAACHARASSDWGYWGN